MGAGQECPRAGPGAGNYRCGAHPAGGGRSFAIQWIAEGFLGEVDNDVTVSLLAADIVAAGVLTGAGLLLVTRAMVVASRSAWLDKYGQKQMRWRGSSRQRPGGSLEMFLGCVEVRRGGRLLRPRLMIANAEPRAGRWIAVPLPLSPLPLSPTGRRGLPLNSADANRRQIRTVGSGAVPTRGAGEAPSTPESRVTFTSQRETRPETPWSSPCVRSCPYFSVPGPLTRSCSSRSRPLYRSRVGGNQTGGEGTDRRVEEGAGGACGVGEHLQPELLAPPHERFTAEGKTAGQPVDHQVVVEDRVAETDR